MNHSPIYSSEQRSKTKVQRQKSKVFMPDEELELLEEENELSLLETLDHVLNRGLVIAGEITVSVDDIDMIYLGVHVLLSSIETAQHVLNNRTKAVTSDKSRVTS